MIRHKVRAFWREQSAVEGTSWQVVFDFLFGVMAPVACLVFDPIVFRDNFLLTDGLLGEQRVFFYSGIGLGIAVLLLHLFAGHRLDGWGSVVGGALLLNAGVALAMGVGLFPFSVIGLLALIGVFGFAPFLTAFVFLRNGVRAVRRASQHLDETWLVGAMGVGAVLMIALPGFLYWQTSWVVDRSIDAILGGEEAESAAAARRLRYASWCSDGCFDEIVWAYQDETAEVRQERLAELYLVMSGEDIEQRLESLQWREWD